MVVLAILVTGGESTENGRTYTDTWDTSVEVISTNGSSICELPLMFQYKRYHTQSGLTACGGHFHGGSSSCIKFEAGDGEWRTLTDNLVEERYRHSSWVTPVGDILLIGGQDSSTTTEIVYQNGSSIRSFDLKYDTK